MKVKLRAGVGYFQDFRYGAWEGESPVFTVVGLINGKLILEAPGYGIIGDYGDGSIFADAESTYPVIDEVLK